MEANTLARTTSPALNPLSWPRPLFPSGVVAAGIQIEEIG